MKTLTAAAIAAILLTSAVHALAATAQQGNHKAKPSSYAPGPKAKDGVYGTPIGTPIVGKRASRNHHGQKAQSAAHGKQVKSTGGAKKKREAAAVPK
ncbi:MAG: hypothetical protein ABI885_04335 [Gammaproteobacteria bacterium]